LVGQAPLITNKGKNTMLLHIIPRLYASKENEPKCALIDLYCPELNLRLRDGIELVARRPYPNKNYLVACRKMGHKAMEGLLIETQERIRPLASRSACSTSMRSGSGKPNFCAASCAAFKTASCSASIHDRPGRDGRMLASRWNAS
jgi:hypothetical protein